jgi:hypothetical protein
MKNFAAFRAVCNIAGILILAYSVYGYLSDELLVFVGKWNAGPKYVHGELVLWAALGWVSLAAAAFFTPADIEATLPLGPRERLSRAVGPALLFLALGICVLGALGISVR